MSRPCCFPTSGLFFKIFSVLGSPKADISFTKPAGHKREITRVQTVHASTKRPNEKSAKRGKRGGIGENAQVQAKTRRGQYRFIRKETALFRLRRAIMMTLASFSISRQGGIDMDGYLTTAAIFSSGERAQHIVTKQMFVDILWKSRQALSRHTRPTSVGEGRQEQNRGCTTKEVQGAIFCRQNREHASTRINTSISTQHQH